MKVLSLKIFKNKILIIFIIIGLVLSSGHAFQTFFNISTYINIVMALLFAIPIIYIYANNKLSTFLVSFLLFIIMVLTTFIIHFPKGYGYYISFLCGIIFAFGIVTTYKFEDFTKVFLKIMTISSVISLIGYIALQSTNLLTNLPMFINVNGVPYNTMFLFSYIPWTPDRNCGMFWEPGMFATFLIYAIIFEIVFKKDNINIFRIILFSITIYTTKSSAGYILWFICIILLLVNKEKYKIKHGMSYFFYTCLFISLILIIFNLDLIILNTDLVQNEYVYKLLRSNIGDSSRIHAITHNLGVFYNNPIFGAGKTEVNRQMAYVADTSTTTNLMSIFGILGSLFTIFFTYGILRMRSKNIFSKLCLVSIILSLINKEPHGGIIFTWCVLFFLLKEISYNSYISTKNNI